MPIRRDAQGRFTTGSGSRPSKAKKLAKIAGHKKAVLSNKTEQKNISQARRPLEKASDRAWRDHTFKPTPASKAALDKAESAQSKNSARQNKLIKQQVKLGNKSKLGGKRVFEFTAGAARKAALAKKRKAKGK